MVRRLLVGVMRHRATTGAVLTLVGAAAVVAAVVADLGRWPYLAGAALAALGLVLLLSRLLRHPAGLVAGALAVVVVIGGGAWLGLHGWPGSAPHWDDETSGTAHLGEDSFRLGRVLFAGRLARDVTTGEVLWTAPKGSHVVTTTDETVVLSEPDEDGDGTRLVARLTDSGRLVWWTVVGDDPRAVARDEGVLVVSTRRGTSAHDLTSGDEIWTSPSRSGAECKGGAPRTPASSVVEQPVLFLPSAGGTRGVDLARVSDGKVVVRDLDCLNYGRVVGDTYVQHGSDGLTGRSVQTGAITWQRKWIEDAEPFSLPASRGRIYIPAKVHGGVVETYHALDLRTGELEETRPPQGWVSGVDVIRDQRAEALWQPVTRSSELGLWQVGTTRVVRFPGAQQIEVAEADTSGWIAVSGYTEDLVGDRVRTTWAVSPEGTRHGPFTGGSDTLDGSATAADGVLRVGSRVYPLD